MMKKISILVIVASFFLISCQRASESDQFSQLRDSMVEEQIIGRGVVDPKVIKAMRVVERQKFVPKKIEAHAYNDQPLPIGYDQTISQPLIVAYMTEALELKGNEKVLEIGTGSGYQSAILAEIAKEVYTIEIIKPLAQRAELLLKGLGYINIHVRYGDGYQGWPQAAPFDAIVVTAAPDEVPPRLVEQLKVGGRMVIPVGADYQKLYLITKTKEGVIQQALIPVRFVPMVKGND